MSNALHPSKLEQEAIAARITAAGMVPAALADANDAFAVGEYNGETLDAWITEQRSKRPHLFAVTGDNDTEAAAFGDRNMTARARLVKAIGEDAAGERAKAWGLSGLTDFKTIGRSPGAKNGGDGGDKRPGRDNPFSTAGWNVSRQGQIWKSDRELCERLAKAAHSRVGATKPTPGF